MQPEVIALGFDTATSHCTVSVVSGSDILAEISENTEKKHAENLMCLIKKALDSAQLNLTDLDVIGVGVGPGNFTGIRISVAAARGLSLALKIPAFGVPKYEAFCFGQDQNTLCTINATKGNVYLIDYVDKIFGKCSLHHLDNLPTNKCKNIIGDQSNKLSGKLNLNELKPLFSPASSIAKIAQDMPIDKCPPKPLYPNLNPFGASEGFEAEFMS